MSLESMGHLSPKIDSGKEYATGQMQRLHKFAENKNIKINLLQDIPPSFKQIAADAQFPLAGQHQIYSIQRPHRTVIFYQNNSGDFTNYSFVLNDKNEPIEYLGGNHNLIAEDIIGEFLRLD